MPVALLLLDLAVRLAGALRPLRFLDGLTIPDDAYLSLTISRNIARGFGLLYGTAPTSGVQPLFPLLMAPAYAIWPHQPLPPVRAALLLLAACDTMVLWMLLGWWRRLVRSDLALVVAGLAWILSPYALQTALNAMETMLACLGLVATAVALDRLRGSAGRSWVRNAFVSGVCAGLAMFARLDAALFAPVGAASILAWGARRDAGPRPVPAALVAFGLGVAAAYAPWLAYQLQSTGDYTPVSGRALHFLAMANVGHHPSLANFVAPMTVKAAVALGRRNVFPLALLGLLAAAVTMRRAWRVTRAGLARVAPLAGFVAVLAFAHTYWFGASWYFSRYFFPTLPLLLTVIAVLVDALARGLAPRARIRAGVALIALTVAGNVAQPPFAKVFLSHDSTTLGYMNLGRWARDRFAPGTVIGGLQTGALGYFGEGLQVVNLDGVVNAGALHALERRRILDYGRGIGVAWIVGWKDDPDYLLSHTAGAGPGELAPMGRIPGFLTWSQPWYLWRLEPRAVEPTP